MANTLQIDVKDRDLLGALRDFFKTVLAQEDIQAILIPRRLPMKPMLMPTLITDPERLDAADPLAPLFPMNAARLVSRLTRKTSGGKLAAVMRPCEIRAFVELVKLNQGDTADLVIFGLDCLGAFSNADYFNWVAEDSDASTKAFYAGVRGGKWAGPDLAPACRACEFPVALGADISLGLWGVDTDSRILVQARTQKGEGMVLNLGLAETPEPAERRKAVDALIAERSAFRDHLFAETHSLTNSLEKLTAYLARCLNCYNCRVACPVCYCRECVFTTDVFDHEPSQYLRWAQKRGALKMPTDTLFYHITRLAHMSLACVGCGQCSNVCPSHIPVMELFSTIAHGAQKGFGYQAGRSLDENPPLSEFREDEFEEVVGIG